jgi:hypothetical protein
MQFGQSLLSGKIAPIIPYKTDACQVLFVNCTKYI